MHHPIPKVPEIDSINQQPYLKMSKNPLTDNLIQDNDGEVFINYHAIVPTQSPRNDGRTRPVSDKQSPSASLTDLPSELIHIILSYYVNRFQELLIFGATNRNLKHLTNYSLLWLELDLAFYLPKRFLSIYYGVTSDVPVSEMIEEEIHRSDTGVLVVNSLDYFQKELNFPGVSKVCVSKKPLIDIHNLPNKESPYEYANRVRIWYLDIFNQYHRLWDLHCRWTPTFNSIRLMSQKVGEYFFQYILIAIFFTSFSVYCFSNLNLCNSNNHQLTALNQVGFICIYMVFFIYLFLLITQTLSVIVDNLYYIHISLKMSFTYKTIFGLDLMYYVFFGVFFSIILTQIKLNYYNSCSSSYSSLSWVEVTIPMWIFFTIGLITAVFGLFQMYYSSFERFLVAGSYAYCMYSLAISCTIAAYYYDNGETGFNLGYALIPVYPLFFGVLLVLITKLFFNFWIFFQYFVLRKNIGFGLPTPFLSNIFCLYLHTVGSIVNVVISYCLIALAISCFDSKKDSSDQWWDEKWLGFHIAPIELVLVFIAASQLFFVLFSLEDRFTTY